jgi:hypothetical protein
VTPQKRRVMMEGHFTINAATTASGTVSYSFSSSQFGLGGSTTYLVELPSLTLYNTYAARCRSALMRYVPYFSDTYVSAADSGTGCGLAVSIPTFAVPTGISLDNLLGYAGNKVVKASKPYSLAWRASCTNDDNAWMGMNLPGLLPFIPNSCYTGFTFCGFMAGCNASIVIGQYFFTFMFEVELPN